MSNYTVEVKQTSAPVTVSETGPAGPAGSGLETFIKEAGEVLTIYIPVYLDGGTVKKARANSENSSKVAGLTTRASAQGETSTYLYEGVITNSDWSAILEGSSTTLTEGSLYYLSATNAGRLTSSAPTTVGQFVVQVGYAQSATKLALQIQPPIKL